ncbi:hypothetical protein J5I95_13785 [Candidatus Poribacteria bacterium]|nr:hypothetical protein [Candidatus Poribacteria bacterium]
MSYTGHAERVRNGSGHGRGDVCGAVARTTNTPNGARLLWGAHNPHGR